MTKRRLPAWLLAAVMCVTCLVTPILGAAAAETTWADATIGQWAPLTADSAILGENNLLSGITPTKDTRPGSFDLSRGTWDIITDNALSVKADYENTSIAVSGLWNNAWRELTFAMDKAYHFDHFVFGGSDEGASYTPHSIKIYVGNELSTLYTDDNLVVDADRFDVKGQHWQFKPEEVVTGRYVGYSMYVPEFYPGTDTEETKPLCYKDGTAIYANWYGQLRIGEIGAYGEAAGDEAMELPWRDATAGQWRTLDTNSTILKETNLLDGISPTKGTVGTSHEVKENTAAISTDGKLTVAGDTTTLMTYQVLRDTWSQFTYALNGYFSLQNFVFSGSMEGSRYVPHQLRIYVSETEEDLYNEENLMVKAEKFDTKGQSWEFKAATAKRGRYVGFEFYCPPWLGADHTVNQTDYPECYDENGNLLYSEWWQLIRLGEIGAYGELLESLPELNYDSVPITKAEDIPEGNLLLGTAVENKPADYLVPTDNGGGGISTSGNTSAAGVVDGLIYGINTPAGMDVNGVGLNMVVSGGFMYDLRGKVEIEKLLISAVTDKDPNYRITYLEMYAADKVSDLFSADPVIRIDLRGKPNQLVTLKESITARYVGFKAPKIGIYDVIRIGELGIYGTYKEDPRPFDDELIIGREPVDSYLSFKDDPARRLRGSYIVYRGQENGDQPEFLNDGDTTNRATIYAIGSIGLDPDWSYSNVNGGDGRKLEPTTPWVVLIYHLGGTCELSSISLTSSNEPGYYIAGAEYYASEKIADLFKEENRLYDTKGGTTYVNEKGIELLDPAYDVTDRSIYCDLYGQGKKARYVAFVITRAHPVNREGYSLARISELSVTGTMLEEDPVFDTALQTVTNKATGISATLSRLNLDDVDFFDGLQLDVKVSDLPKGVATVFDDNWLRVDSKVYTLTLKDKNGKAYTPEEVGTRVWDIQIPKTNTCFQMAAALADGTLTRVRSSYTDPDERYVKLGTAYGNESTIYGNGMQYVLIRYNTLDELHTLNNVVQDAPAEYYTKAASDILSKLPVWPAALLVALLVATVVLILIRRRRVSR